jgi:hypothetical protein
MTGGRSELAGVPPLVISEKWDSMVEGLWKCQRADDPPSFFLLGRPTIERAPLFVVFEGWEPRTGTS